MNHTNDRAWEKLGFSPEKVAGFAARDVRWLEFWTVPRPEPDEVENWMSGVALPGSEVFTLGVLGHVIDHDAYRDWRAVGRRFVDDAVFYFLGDWRESFVLFGVQCDRVSSRKELPWSLYMRHSLAIAAALGEWEKFDRLISSIGTDLRWDEATDRQTNEDNQYLMWLAAKLSSRTQEALELEAEIMASRRPRTKMLLKAALAMFDGDGQTFSRALDAYVQAYRVQELRLTTISTGVCWNGTVLYHLAVRRGLPASMLSELNRLVIAEYK